MANCPVCNERVGILYRLLDKFTCPKCRRTCHSACTRAILDFRSSQKGKVRKVRLCKKCANKNLKQFGKGRYCPVCKKDITIISQKVKICLACGKPYHAECGVCSLNYSEYKIGKIQKDIYCPNCRSIAEANSMDFGNDRYCPQCGNDITQEYELDHCEICGAIKCHSCLTNNARSIYGDIIVNSQAYLPTYERICQPCSSRIKRIVEKTNYPIIVKSNSIKNFRLIKDFGLIQVESGPRYYFDEMNLKKALVKKALEQGGNAVFGYKLEKLRREVLKGYSDNSNPFYQTVIYYICSGRAVLIEEKEFPSGAPRRYFQPRPSVRRPMTSERGSIIPS